MFYYTQQHTKASFEDYQISASLKPCGIFLSKTHRTALPTITLKANSKDCVHLYRCHIYL